MGIIGAIWGFVGVFAFIGFAVVRLAPLAAEALRSPLSPLQWGFLIVFAAFMLVAEGYRGFQKKFSPRTAARVRHLKDNPNPLHVLLAPVFCMGYIHATKKTRITVICLTLGIITLVLLVRLLPFPWRGLIDFGVVLGLSYGLISFAVCTLKALAAANNPYSPEVPRPPAS